MKIRGYIVVLLSAVFSISCGKESCNVVPNVSFRTNINQAEHLEAIAVIGGWSYAAGGVCGLIVYNTGVNLVAYDRCSTLNIEQRNAVVVNGLTIEDPQTGAKWLLIDGSPIEIAHCSLKPYYVSKSGNFYYVSN